MTYVDLVNAVLRRLRETECNSVQDTGYTKLIGDFVNETKEEVENAFNWRQLYTYVDISTVAGTSTYTLTGTGTRTRFPKGDQYNISYKNELRPATKTWMNHQTLLAQAPNGESYYYAVVGHDDTTEEVIIEVFPAPIRDGDTLRVYCFNPQADLSDDDDNMKVPSSPVIAGAWARAISERGEDGGRMADAQFGIYKSTLADFIAIASAEQEDDTTWERV